VRVPSLTASALVWISVASIPLAACNASAKREAAALAMAVDKCRRADAANRPQDVKSVEDFACTADDVCAAKKSCAVALARTADALAIKDRVAKRLDDIEAKRLSADSPEAEDLPVQLDAATRLLGEGRVQMAVCDSRLADLSVKYH
jgi:hypothetical protein